jgi:hypothetical protein
MKHGIKNKGTTILGNHPEHRNQQIIFRTPEVELSHEQLSLFVYTLLDHELSLDDHDSKSQRYLSFGDDLCIGLYAGDKAPLNLNAQKIIISKRSASFKCNIYYEY